MRTLVQRKLWNKREFRLEEGKVFYGFSRKGKLSEVVVPFESLSGEQVRHEEENYYYLLVAFVSFVATFLQLFTLLVEGEPYWKGGWMFPLVASAAVAGYFLTRKRFIKVRLTNDTYLYFYRSIPNESEVEDFIATMLRERNAYLLAQYGVLNRHLNYEQQFQNWKWLVQMNVIRQTEFEEKEAELNRLFRKEERLIGFR